MDKAVLKTSTIQGISGVVTYPGNILKLSFESDDALSNFCLWLARLREDATRAPTDRYEEVRVQMADSADPARAE